MINTGIAGSLNNDINIGDIVLSTDTLQHDMDVVAFGYELGQVPRMDVKEFKDFALSVPQMTQLSKTVETVFPNLHASLEAIYANFDRNDWLHCCLYLLQLDKMSICVLLQEPYYKCRRCTLKLEEAFNCRHAIVAFLIEQAENC